jgi:zinc/manganese transport system ATP-binding protein
MNDSSRSLIEMNEVWTTYEGADRPVIRDITLKIQAGEFVVIGGPNGAGKTTLLETIAGLLPVIHGSIRVCGKNPVSEGCQVRKQIGYVIQNFDFHPFTPFTVEEIVLMGRYGKIGWFRRHTLYDNQLVKKAMEILGISSICRDQIGKLSGGQQQKVLIAHNIAKEPDILLLDEPFSNLDMLAREEVCKILCNIADSGIPILLVSHAFDAMPDRTLRVIVMKDGSIILNTLSNPSDVSNIVRSASVAA